MLAANFQTSICAQHVGKQRALHRNKVSLRALRKRTISPQLHTYEDHDNPKYSWARTKSTLSNQYSRCKQFPGLLRRFLRRTFSHLPSELTLGTTDSLYYIPTHERADSNRIPGVSSRTNSVNQVDSGSHMHQPSRRGIPLSGRVWSIAWARQTWDSQSQNTFTWDP